MLKYVLLLLVTGTYTLAQKKCCLPDQFEGLIGDISGFVANEKPGISTGFIFVAFDYTEKMVADYINLTTNGVPYIAKLLLDYNKNVMYTIDERKRTCNATRPAPPLQRCLPDQAKEIGTFYYGTGKNSLKARSYSFSDPAKTINAIATFTMDCIPIGEVAYGSQNGVPFMTSMGWANIQKGIKDPSVFALPKFCKGVKVVDAKSDVFMGRIFHSKKPGFS